MLAAAEHPNARQDSPGDRFSERVRHRGPELGQGSWLVVHLRVVMMAIEVHVGHRRIASEGRRASHRALLVQRGNRRHLALLVLVLRGHS